MKRFISLTLLVLLITTPVFASPRSVLSVKSATNDTVFNVPTTTTVYTRSFTVKGAENDNDIGIMYKASNANAPTLIDINLELEQSYAPPTTEGSSDTKYLPSLYYNSYYGF